MLKKLAGLLFVFFQVTQMPFAQHQPQDKDVLFRTHMVRALDLDWSTSKDIFGSRKLIPEILIEAMERGEIKGYTDSKLKDEISFEKVIEKISICDWDSCYQYLSPQHFHELELGEELVFDSRRSEHYFIPQYLAIYIPEKLNVRGLKEPWVVFKFEDCEKVFRSDERAWSEKKLIGGRRVNYADLFVMKCFYTEFVKIGHSHDHYFDQIYEDRINAFLASKDAEKKLVDFLYSLYNPK